MILHLPGVRRGDHVRHDKFPGIALWYIEQGQWQGEPTDPDISIVQMVGDDRHHEVDTAGLASLNEDDFCGQCGQIGCAHG